MNELIKLSLLTLLILQAQCATATPTQSSSRNKIPPAKFTLRSVGTKIICNREISVENSKFIKNKKITIWKTIATDDENSESVITYTTLKYNECVMRSVSISDGEILQAHRSRHNHSVLVEDNPTIILNQLRCHGVILPLN